MADLLDYRVLFIEDDKEVNRKISSRLKRYFKYVYSFFNAEDGYLAYLDKKPHIVFIDINLPKMSGIELFKKDKSKRSQYKSSNVNSSI